VTVAASPGSGGLDRSDFALLETLVYEAPVAFAFYDTELRYRRINRALARTNGLPIDVHLGRRPTEVLPGGLGAAIEAMLRQVLTTGETVTDDDFTAIDPTGERRHWQSAWYPARDEAGTVIGVAVLVSDVTERRRAEEQLRLSHRRTDRLQRATAALASALTLDDVAAIVRDVGRDPGGAIWAGIALVEGDEIQFAGSGVAIVDSLHRVPYQERTPTTVALRTGLPVYLRSRVELRERFGGPRADRYLAETDEHAWAVLPLRGLAGPRAALRLAFGEERDLGPDERLFLEALAGQCALALERARLFEREHRTAAALQASLLPGVLPTLPGVQVAARFVPAAADAAEVGGDWYDVFPLPTGEVAIVVGDVMGKGVVAAAGMGRVRAALRALSLSDPAPAAVLSGLDRVFSATEDDEQLVTLVYAVVDARSGRVRVGAAGHPPLLLLPADGPPRFLDETVGGMPLGLPEPRRELSLTLAPGDTLLGYSDGLVERHGRDLDEAFAALLDAAERAREDELTGLVDAVVAAMAADRRRDDDMTLLALRTEASGLRAPDGDPPADVPADPYADTDARPDG
jgi:PAS domain S-box-containing protein